MYRNGNFESYICEVLCRLNMKFADVAAENIIHEKVLEKVIEKVLEKVFEKVFEKVVENDNGFKMRRK